ncbi:hypothetical protein [Teredinibacter sp. KSP-S5-2]|uniref:hypothetical protein n=1 Tax=Teredinibacter sp. KSP-S5-2 TaxID=3034506 RepID=UPI002934AC50|nr:hypothetical protein [Teredinibacter sp. KSP-S5-2]WNO10142.1 hypothetical protein P5V12_03050 [Teredinibacter sp. KSP-S5-2]
MNNICKTLMLGLPLCFSLYGCDDTDDNTNRVDSDYVATGDIYATIQVVADEGDTIYAETQLTKGVPPSYSGKIYVQLVNSDELWFSAGDNISAIDLSDDFFGEFAQFPDTQDRFYQAKTTSERYGFLWDKVIINEYGTWYSAELPKKEQTEFTISLLRDHKTSAVNSMVKIPGDFQLIQPQSIESFSRSTDDIVVEWNNLESDTQVEVEAVTTCSDYSVETYSQLFDTDLGSATITAGSLQDVSLVGDCTTTLNLRKIKIGQFDSKFIGGTINGYQIRRVSLVTSN